MAGIRIGRAAVAAWLAAVAWAAPPARAAAPEADPAVRAGLVEVLEGARHPWLRRSDLGDVQRDLAALYGAGPGALVWFEGERPAPALASAVDLLGAATDAGLDPSGYDAALLAERASAAARAPLAPRERALLDTAVATGVLRYFAEVHRGRVDPRRAGAVAGPPAEEIDLPRLVREARDGNRVREAAAALEPRYPGYVRLRAALASYRALTPGPELPPLPPAARVGPGDAWPGLPALRARLATLGDLAANAPDRPPGDPARYEGAVVDAVRRFQERHGLAADGKLGKRTLAEIDVPPARRVRQIELAMERYRWLPPPSRRMVLVEIPRAELWALDLYRAPAETALRMRVVVGEPEEHRTPMLATAMTGVVFRPYWVPTLGIVREEILPRERARPGWLARHGMEIVASGAEDAEALPPTEENLAQVERARLTVRQRPGPRNDLGPVKFVVPNPASICLHGTPHRGLFEQPRRDRSHGCVRLEDPAALAEWALRDAPGWDAAHVEAAMNRDRPTWVKLPQPIPVVLLYATASADPDGRVQFRDDIYGLDALLEEELRRVAER